MQSQLEELPSLACGYVFDSNRLTVPSAMVKKAVTVIKMRGEPKQVYYKSWKQVSQASKELASQPHRFLTQLKSIVLSAFGNNTQQGLISNRLNYYYQNGPIHWAEEMQLIFSMFSSGQPLFSSSLGIIACSDYEMQIDPKLLPRFVVEEFLPQPGGSSSLLERLKRGPKEQYVISLWEWFWIHATYALVNSPEIQETRTLAQDYQEDELFFLISRNPILMIFHKALVCKALRVNQNQLCERMASIIELYVLEEMASSTAFLSENRYQLKSQGIALVILLVNSRCKPMEGERLKLYHQFFSKAADHFEKMTSQSKNTDILRNLIRAWTFFLTRQHGVEYKIISQLQRANPRDGCYRVERCPLGKWLHSAKNTEIYKGDRLAIIATRKNIYRLLRKQGEWRPSFSFLAVLEQFSQFDKTILSAYIKTLEAREEDLTLNRSFERILTHLSEAGADRTLLKELQGRLNLRLENAWSGKITTDFGELSQESRHKTLEVSQEDKRHISFQSSAVKNVWQYPRQDNQYEILLRGSKWAAKQVDKLIPGHRERSQPYLNLRIFANPCVFTVFILMLALILRFLLS